MISQGLQTSTLAKVVSRQEMSEGDLQRAIAQGALAEAIAELQDFIALRPNAREVRKALFCQTGLSRLLV
jgi:putative transposase